MKLNVKLSSSFLRPFFLALAFSAAIPNAFHFCHSFILFSIFLYLSFLLSRYFLQRESFFLLKLSFFQPSCVCVCIYLSRFFFYLGSVRSPWTTRINLKISLLPALYSFVQLLSLTFLPSRHFKSCRWFSLKTIFTIRDTRPKSCSVSWNQMIWPYYCSARNGNYESVKVNENQSLSSNQCTVENVSQ